MAVETTCPAEAKVEVVSWPERLAAMVAVRPAIPGAVSGGIPRRFPMLKLIFTAGRTKSETCSWLRLTIHFLTSKTDYTRVEISNLSYRV